MFENVSTEELQAEIKRRERKKKSPPKQMNGINIDSLKSVCQAYVDELDKNGYANANHKQYIFETALECLYGCKIWEWVKEKSV